MVVVAGDAVVFCVVIGVGGLVGVIGAVVDGSQGPPVIFFSLMDLLNVQKTKRHYQWQAAV